MRAGEAVRATPFELTFDRYASFRSRGKAPLVLLCGSGKVELMALQRAVGAALGHTKAARFEPHCTLLYGQSSVPTTRLEEPITWRVRELVLVHSLQGRGIYRHPGRWPLRG